MESDVKFNDYCYQIDTKLWGLPQNGAAYIVQSGKTAIIDAGTAHNVRDVQKSLNNLKIDISRIDYMIITHEHYDHGAGAAPLLEKMPNAKVFASEPTSKVLKNPKEIHEKTLQYYGEARALVSPYAPVKDVNIIKEHDKLELGNGVILEVVDLKGHTPGSIGLLEHKTKTLFAGDAVCVYNEQTDFYLPPSYPDLFDYQTYQRTLKKMLALDFDYLCLGHFGTLKQPKAKQVIKKASEVAEGWKEIITKTYPATKDEDKVLEALRAKYGNAIQKAVVGQMIVGYLVSLKLT
jgi:glyoxylase-like metal-dependent hydrolase (beta-lactamase superfamily II)